MSDSSAQEMSGVARSNVSGISFVSNRAQSQTSFLDTEPHRVEASLHMDSAAARGICRREGVGKVKSLEVRTLWFQQVVKAKTLTLRTVKSQGNCADLGTKTLTAGTFSLLRNLNGLVDKNTMDNISCGVQSITISPGESRMLRATALEVLERTLDEIARNNRVMSRGERMMRGLEPEQLHAMCANSLQDWGKWKCHDVDVGTIVKSLVVHAHLPRLLSCLCNFSD